MCTTVFSYSGASMKSRSPLVRFSIYLASVVLISVISLRTLYFSPGFYSYSDVHWGLLLKPDLIGTFSTPFSAASGFPLFDLNKDVITWPYGILLLLNVPMQSAERVLIFYVSTLYLFLSFILAERIVVFLEHEFKFQLSPIFFYAIVFVSSVFSYSNLEALEFNVDGGFFSDGLIMLFLSIECLLIISKGGQTKNWLLIASLLALSTLLDPDYYILSLWAIIIVAITAGHSRGTLVKNIKGIGFSIFASLPVIFFYYFVGIHTLPPQSSLSASLGAIRSIPYGPSQFNPMYPIYYLMLIGHSWSTMAFGPPTILLYSGRISSLKGMFSPTQILLPPGNLTALWFASLAIVPALAFVPFLVKKTRKTVSPLIILVLLTLLVTQYTASAALYNTVKDLTRLPLIGPSIGTSLALPGHMIMIIAASYILLIPISLFSILAMINEFEVQNLLRSAWAHSSIKGHTFSSIFWRRLVLFKKYVGTNKRVLSCVIITIYMATVIFTGWQAFDGSYFPDRAFPPDNGGNQIPELAPYQPYVVPQNAMDVLNYLNAQPGAFNTFQVIAPYVNNQTPPLFEGYIAPDLSHNGNALVGSTFDYLIRNNLSQDIAPLMSAYSIRYIVVEYYNITQSLVHNEFGFYNFQRILQILSDSPGIVNVLAYNSIALYRVAAANNLVYQSQLLLNSHDMSGYYPVIYSLFQSLGLEISITPDPNFGIGYLFNSWNSTIAILSPTFLNKSVLSESVDSVQSIYDTGAIFGDAMLLNGSLFRMPIASQFISSLLFVSGTGQIGSNNINFSSPHWVSISGTSTITFRGNLSIFAAIALHAKSLVDYLSRNVVYNVGASRGYFLKINKTEYDGTSTVYGAELFPNVSAQGKYVVIAPYAPFENDMYCFLIVEICTMVAVYWLFAFETNALLKLKKILRLNRG